MQKNKKELTWAIAYLANHKKIVNDYQRIVDTSYSVVYKINTINEIFYLKITPELLFSESGTLQYLHEQGCQHIPHLLAQDSQLKCFLTRSCGDESLRHLFDGVVDFKQLMTGISNYSTIQRLLEKNIQSFLSMGIPDWRLAQFPYLYEKLIHQEALLIADGVTASEMNMLFNSYALCKQLCNDLAAYKIPETLSHCDFHDNNMLLDRKTGAINIIDWGETAIAHPFFSLNGCLWQLTYCYRLKTSDPAYVKSQCIAPWLNGFDETSLLKAFGIANRLLGIYAALSYQRMYNATHHQLKTVQDDHHGAIAGCLRSFLNQI